MILTWCFVLWGKWRAAGTRESRENHSNTSERREWIQKGNRQETGKAHSGAAANLVGVKNPSGAGIGVISGMDTAWGREGGIVSVMANRGKSPMKAVCVPPAEQQHS